MPTGDVTFPFLPKSNSFLARGMIWDIPLRDGSYACGRVYSPRRKSGKSRFSFWGALLDWHGSEKPTVQAISGPPVLWQGCFDVRSLAHSGSMMLDILPLEADDFMVPPVLTSLLNGIVTLGYDEERPATETEFRTLPIMCVWENNQSFIRIAEEVFLDGKPMHHERTPVENELLDKLGISAPGDLKKRQAEIARDWRRSKRAKPASRKSKTRVEKQS
ncbi:hypothetical protein OKA04_12970 [Luteolibacter flavescens]|uniref:Uncharacterized protein n=1 Tax=Luteolibacter flavescens TaxID=1859460 RepID=A0ABT3FQR0_9BACT|nr:hypothetical protein [Luteolibacter flavescens]MCW1885644.1 hypothetical protein [Luteolibacter flavescens]